MTPEVDDASPRPEVPSSFLNNPWVQLSAGIVAMVAITNLQYGWTFFVQPIADNIYWDWPWSTASRQAIQIAFTLFILAETWLLPFEGYVVDRLGPRLPVAVGGILIALAWMMNSWAESLATLYAAGVIGGAGAGVVYGTSMGNALKWFTHRRGLAAGLTSAAFGAGSALTVMPLFHTIEVHGYQAAFFWFGLAQGAVVLLCALTMRVAPVAPAQPVKSAIDAAPAGRDFSWREMLRTPAFWLLYLMMTLVAVGGLSVVQDLDKMALDFGVKETPVTLFGKLALPFVGPIDLGITMLALPFAVQIDRILNGLTRPFFGWVSDRLGRENTMFIAFSFQGTALLLFMHFAHVPILFVLFSGLVFFGWGEIYSLFPAVCGDIFGRKFATTNYGLLYTAKGTAALLLLLVPYLYRINNSWTPVFWLFVAIAWTVAFMALFVIKPLHRRMAAEVIQEK